TWPDDFLFAFGSFDADGCGSGSFGFYAVPRKLFVQYAVIESATQLLDISSLTFEVDPQEELRKQIGPGEQLELPIGNITLQRGETLVVPLHLELRYDLQEYPFQYLAEQAKSKSIYKTITGAPVDTFSFYDNFGSADKPKNLVRKTKGEFKPPAFQPVSQK